MLTDESVNEFLRKRLKDTSFALCAEQAIPDDELKIKLGVFYCRALPILRTKELAGLTCIDMRLRHNNPTPGNSHLAERLGDLFTTAEDCLKPTVLVGASGAGKTSSIFSWALRQYVIFTECSPNPKISCQNYFSICKVEELEQTVYTDIVARACILRWWREAMPEQATPEAWLHLQLDGLAKVVIDVRVVMARFKWTNDLVRQVIGNCLGPDMTVAIVLDEAQLLVGPKTIRIDRYQFDRFQQVVLILSSLRCFFLVAGTHVGSKDGLRCQSAVAKVHGDLYGTRIVCDFDTFDEEQVKSVLTNCLNLDGVDVKLVDEFACNCVGRPRFSVGFVEFFCKPTILDAVREMNKTTAFEYVVREFTRFVLKSIIQDIKSLCEKTAAVKEHAICARDTLLDLFFFYAQGGSLQDGIGFDIQRGGVLFSRHFKTVRSEQDRYVLILSPEPEGVSDPAPLDQAGGVCEGAELAETFGDLNVSDELLQSIPHELLEDALANEVSHVDARATDESFTSDQEVRFEIPVDEPMMRKALLHYFHSSGRKNLARRLSRQTDGGVFGELFESLLGIGLITYSGIDDCGSPNPTSIKAFLTTQCNLKLHLEVMTMLRLKASDLDRVFAVDRIVKLETLQETKVWLSEASSGNCRTIARFPTIAGIDLCWATTSTPSTPPLFFCLVSKTSMRSWTARVESTVVNDQMGKVRLEDQFKFNINPKSDSTKHQAADEIRKSWMEFLATQTLREVSILVEIPKRGGTAPPVVRLPHGGYAVVVDYSNIDNFIGLPDVVATLNTRLVQLVEKWRKAKANASARAGLKV